jgi:large subunit ribosomal protein L4
MVTKEDIKTSLPKEIFDVPMNSDLLHQVVVSQMANRRVAISHTKDRSEVRGGGAKPWRQKGTGRARHGSRRSPIWIGGGVTHGPTNERNFKKRLPKNIKKKALFIALSEKLRNDLIIIVDSFDINEIKTKKVIEMLNNLGIKESCLIVLSKIDSNIILSTRNIPKVNTIQAKDINCLDILSSKHLLIDKEGLKVIEETFKK